MNRLYLDILLSPWEGVMRSETKSMHLRGAVGGNPQASLSGASVGEGLQARAPSGEGTRIEAYRNDPPSPPATPADDRSTAAWAGYPLTWGDEG